MSNWQVERKVISKGVASVDYYDIYYNGKGIAIYPLGQNDNIGFESHRLYGIPFVVGFLTAYFINIFTAFVVAGILAGIVYEINSKLESKKHKNANIEELIKSGKADAYKWGDVRLEQKVGKSVLTTPDYKLNIKKKVGKKLQGAA